MKNKIYEAMKEEVSIKLGNLFKKGLVYEDVQLKHIPVSDFLQIIEEVFDDVTDISDIKDMNGWQADYWIDFKYKGIKYDVIASGYYGTIDLSIDERELPPDIN